MLGRLAKAVPHRTRALWLRSESFIRKQRYPAHGRRAMRVGGDEEHLAAAMGWLCRAQDASGCGGVSALYHVAQGRWQLPYRETTGYIIPTFLRYYRHTGNAEYLKRAIAMGEWELRVQLPNGAVYEPCKGEQVGQATRDGAIGIKVFNTGMVIFGLLALFGLTTDRRYLSGARLAGDWLLNEQSADGSWDRFIDPGSKCIHSLVAWALLELGRVATEPRYCKAAASNVAWVLAQQQPSGWFANSSLDDPLRPWTHAIAYTLRGLLECASHLDDGQTARDAAALAARAMVGREMHPPGAQHLSYLPCTFDDRWASDDDHSCLTGNVQTAIIWLSLHRQQADPVLVQSACRLIDGVKATQALDCRDRNIRGGVPGSWPMHCGYGADCVLNWATKFLADAIMVRNGWDAGERVAG